MKTSKFRLTARKAERAPGAVDSVAVELFAVKERVVVECTLPELPALAQALADKNKPCAVWIGVEGRKPNGFDKAKAQYVNLGDA